jgi:predicted  nucleic acid-binding Zn-ribbon protein
MVDKKDKAQSRRSELDQHVVVANRVVASLEKKIERFEERVTQLQTEISELKNQHSEVIALLKEHLGKK